MSAEFKLLSRIWILFCREGGVMRGADVCMSRTLFYSHSAFVHHFRLCEVPVLV